MKKIVIAVILLAASPALTQTSPQFAPIADRDLWDAMQRAFADIPMSLAAHQQVQQIMMAIQREAAAREARAKATQEKADPAKP